LTLVEIEQEMLRFSHLLDAGLAKLRETAGEYAAADVAYKRAYSEAFLRAEGAGVHREQVAVDASLAEREAVKNLEGLNVAALEAVRSRRTQISALQSLLAAHKAEADFSRTGPQ
jgi:hypothetical protein